MRRNASVRRGVRRTSSFSRGGPSVQGKIRRDCSLTLDMAGLLSAMLMPRHRIQASYVGGLQKGALALCDVRPSWQANSAVPDRQPVAANPYSRHTQRPRADRSNRSQPPGQTHRLEVSC
jgi:hypothetical protein